MSHEQTTVAAADLAMFRKAASNLDAANAIMQFTRLHLAEVYQLNGLDSFDLATGEITRAKPEPPAEGGAPC